LLLDVKKLTVCYGPLKVLSGISFAVNDGEIVAMIGPNGAGKSTAVKAVSGLLDATGGSIESGEILFAGKSVKGFRTDQLVRKGMVLVPEGRRVFHTMTVLENLEMGAYTRSDRASIRDDIGKILTLFPQLKARIKQKAGRLSTGEQQMLAIGRALMLKPKLLLADEPSLGLSPRFVDMISQKFVEINRNGTSVLLVEQNVQMALELCHRAYVFEVGSIAIEGTKETLARDENIRKVFLGVGQPQVGGDPDRSRQGASPE